MTRSSKLLVYGMAAIFGFILIQKAFILYTDFLWFDAMGQGAVFSKILGTRVVLGLLVGIAFFAFLYLNVRFARRPLPDDLTLIGRRILPEEEREQIEEYADRALMTFGIIGGLMAGIVASGKWREWLQFTHGIDFGTVDPLFAKDVGFYVFKLGFVSYIWQAAYYAVVITLVVSVLVHIYQEAVRIVGNTIHAIPRARIHILSLLGIALLMKAYSYRLAQYGLLYSQRGEEFFGPSYADVHARLPVLYGLIVLAIVAGIIMFVSTRLKNLFIPAGALAGLIVVSLIGGWIYPAAVQTLVVKPTQLEKETPFIKYNIEATLEAYGLSSITIERHAVRNDLTRETIKQHWGTIENIRLWDHRPIETTFQQQQALRRYYHFADADVDRYIVNDRLRQVLLSARQLDYSRVGDAWINRHLLYTHGFGLVMAPVNEVAGEGSPNYWIKDIPPQSSVGFEIDQAALYYYVSLQSRLIEYIHPPERDTSPDAAAPGAQPGGPPGEPQAQPPTQQQPASSQQISPEQQRQAISRAEPPFVIVNTKARELHYPRAGEEAFDDTAALEDNVYTHYSGSGGVQLSNMWRRLCFAIRFRDIRILLSEYITTESRIMFNRSLPERLAVLAPFMGYDPDPYVAIINKRLTWICDAYTVSNMYPYSARTRWFGGNYMRNSVKAVVDAYEGKPTFYVMKPSPGQRNDPVVEVWQAIFPSLFTDAATMSPDLRRHIRYPALLFRIQAEIFAEYHMRDPQVFFQKEDLWAIPPEVYAKGIREVEAYYINMKLPHLPDPEEEFLIMLPFALARAENRNMVAWMAGRCDGENYGELICYQFPKESLVYGPMMVESRISQDPEISQLITLWSQRQSRIIRGNLLVIPVGNSLLYVEPFYLEAPDFPMPQLKLVVLAYQDEVINAPSLEAAVEKLLNRLEGKEPRPTTAPRPDVLPPGAPGAVVPEPVPAPEPTPAPALPTPTEVSGAKELLQRAIELDAEAQAALSAGDLATYQAKQKERSELVNRAYEVMGQ